MIFLENHLQADYITGIALWVKNEVTEYVLRNKFNFHSVSEIMNSSGLLQRK